jgi:hypothetical protein
MKPKNYTEKNGKTTYHYTFKELKEFLEHGYKEGNNGWIVT